MNRERVIVSIGEVLLVQQGGARTVGGLAADYAIAAVKYGCAGVAVSRIGQDADGEDVLRMLREQSVGVSHVQSDPDLPTGRLITRAIAGQMSTTLTARAAFDNLQWDFDLVDLAQRAEIAFFGQLARRGGQTQSVIRQFLLECVAGNAALRVFDLTNREGTTIERSAAWSALEACDVLLADEPSLRRLVPLAGEDAREAVLELLRSSKVMMVILLSRAGDGAVIHAHTRTEESSGPLAMVQGSHVHAIVQVILALLAGQSLELAVKSAAM